MRGQPYYGVALTDSTQAWRPVPPETLRIIAGVKYFLAIECGLTAWPAGAQGLDPSLHNALRWRAIGPFRGGRTVGAAGVPQPNAFYIGVDNGDGWMTDKRCAAISSRASSRSA